MLKKIEFLSNQLLTVVDLKKVVCVGLKFNLQNPRGAYRPFSGAPESVLMLNNHTTTFINYDNKYL
jgi:hypothetical protein